MDTYYSRNKERIKEYIKTEEYKIKKRAARKKRVAIKGASLKEEKTKRNYHLKKTYNITTEVYDVLLLKQNGQCAICKKNQSDIKRRLSVDHSHSNGKVRGLLCYNCNTAIGYFKENISCFLEAIKYLQYHA
jgi:hypothetical protein